MNDIEKLIEYTHQWQKPFVRIIYVLCFLLAISVCINIYCLTGEKTISFDQKNFFSEFNTQKNG